MNRPAQWHVTDTMAVPVTVRNVTDDGRAYITASSGAKWVQLSELSFPPADVARSPRQGTRRGGYT